MDKPAFFACWPSQAKQLQGGIFREGASVHRVREGLAKNSNAADASAAGQQAKKKAGFSAGLKS